MTYLERVSAKHQKLVDQVLKAAELKDKAIRALLRATTKHDRAAKAVARSQRRIDKVREDDRVARAARKAAKVAGPEPELII